MGAREIITGGEEEEEEEEKAGKGATHTKGWLDDAERLDEPRSTGIEDEDILLWRL